MHWCVCGTASSVVTWGERGTGRSLPRPPRPRVCVTPPCDIPSGCCSFTGPWTVTRSSLRMLCRAAAFCRPLRPVLLLVSFPRSRSPVVGVPGVVLVVAGVVCVSAAPNSWRIEDVLVVAGVHRPPPPPPPTTPLVLIARWCPLMHLVHCPRAAGTPSGTATPAATGTLSPTASAATTPSATGSRSTSASPTAPPSRTCTASPTRPVSQTLTASVTSTGVFWAGEGSARDRGRAVHRVCGSGTA